LQTERFTSPASNQTLSEIPFLVNLELGNPGNQDYSLSTTQTLYFGKTDHRIRHDGELRISRKITDDFSINIYVYDSYDSGTPISFPNHHLDYGYTIGLKYSF